MVKVRQDKKHLTAATNTHESRKANAGSDLQMVQNKTKAFSHLRSFVFFIVLIPFETLEVVYDRPLNHAATRIVVSYSVRFDQDLQKTLTEQSRD